MGFLNPSPEDDYRIQTMGMQNPTADLPNAGRWEGLGEAGQKGVAGGLSKVTDMVGAIGDKIDSAADAYLPSWMASAVHYAPFNPNAVDNAVPDDIRKRNEGARDVMAKWAETGQDPRITGQAGRMLFDTTQGLTVYGIGAAAGGPLGAAALSGATFGHASYVAGKKAGLDDSTALAQSIIAGGAASLGAFIPGKFGDSLVLNTVGSGATNAAFGMAQRGATSSLLDANGYHDMADQYRIMDHESIVADTILGSVFGGVAHVAGFHRATPDRVDVAAAMSTDEHYARSAPGVPTSPEVANLHGEAMREAMDALAEGREPNTPADTAQRIADGVVPDTQHDSVPAAIEAAHTELPGFTEAVDAVQPVEPPARSFDDIEKDMHFALDGARDRLSEALPGEAAAPGKSATFPSFDGFTAARVERLLKDFGDMNYEGPEGHAITVREAIEQMHRDLGDVDKMAAAHEAAAACFLHTGTAG